MLEPGKESANFCHFASIDSGLIIDLKWLRLILAGRKNWELRSAQTNKRGPVALIEKGSGSVVGVAKLIDVKGPFNTDDLAHSESNHQIPPEIYRESGYKWHYAWVLQDAIALPSPVPYRHKSGAVIWVKLDEDVQQSIVDQLQSLGWSSSSGRPKTVSPPALTPPLDKQANYHSAGRVESGSKSPIAKGGSFFCRQACWRANGYTVGEKGAEQHFQDFEAALDYLRGMPVAKWRRPNQNGDGASFLLLIGLNWKILNGEAHRFIAAQMSSNGSTN